MLWFSDSIFLLLLFMRLQISVILCDYIFHYIREHFSLSYAILAFFVCPCYFLCIQRLAHTHTHTPNLTQHQLEIVISRLLADWKIQMKLKWAAHTIEVRFVECSFTNLIALSSSTFRLFSFSIYYSCILHHFPLIAITYLFIRLKITKHNLRCQLLIFSHKFKQFPSFMSQPTFGLFLTV